MQTNINIAKKLHADHIHGRYIALEKWIIGLFECVEKSNKIHKDEQINLLNELHCKLVSTWEDSMDSIWNATSWNNIKNISNQYTNLMNNLDKDSDAFVNDILSKNFVTPIDKQHLDIQYNEQISNVDDIYNDRIQQTKKQMKTSTMQYTK
jgi:hypothetical protein